MRKAFKYINPLIGTCTSTSLGVTTSRRSKLPFVGTSTSQRFKLLTILILFTCAAFRVSVWVPIDKETLSKKLEEVNAQFKNMQSYSLNVTHASFEDYTTVIPYERMQGYFKKDKQRYHSFLLGIHTIQNTECKVVIDSARSTISVSDPSSAFENTLTSNDYSTLLKLCSGLKKAEEGKQMLYRLEFPKENTVGMYEFNIGQGSLLNRMAIYYNKEIKRENGTVTKPRMEIKFSEWKTAPVFSGDDFNQAKYVIKKGNTYVLSASYAGTYKLLDQRVVTKNK